MQCSQLLLAGGKGKNRLVFAPHLCPSGGDVDLVPFSEMVIVLFGQASMFYRISKERRRLARSPSTPVLQEGSVIC